MIAETGSMVKVSGSISETPLGAPRPGRTPTRMPSSTPAIIKRMWWVVSATEKPCISEATLSMRRSRFRPAADHSPSRGSSGPFISPIWKKRSKTT